MSEVYCEHCGVEMDKINTCIEKVKPEEMDNKNDIDYEVTFLIDIYRCPNCYKEKREASEW